MGENDKYKIFALPKTWLTEPLTRIGRSVKNKNKKWVMKF